MVRLARQSPAVAALNIGQSRLSRLARAFLADRLTRQAFSDWVIAYADPTGEAAVRNVMAARS